MHSPLNRLTAGNSGFTLVELAIVMIIMALLAGGMIVPLSAQQDLRANAETTRQLNDIREALIGYAVVNGHFPCPAKSPFDGKEERDTSGKCTKLHGLLPWVTLSMQPGDSWGHLFQYSVTSAFANGAFTIGSDGDIRVKTRNNVGVLTDLTNADIPAVIFSTGKNGHLSWNVEQPLQNADTDSPNGDEETNALATADGKTFISRTASGADLAGGEFDDLVTWISFNILVNRMVAANKLP